MAIVLEINDLSYKDFSNINLEFKDKTYYSIIGSNNSGKTTLFKLITGIIPSIDKICCNNTYLNRRNVNKYIVNLGIVERIQKNSFIYKKVIDEMMYPLYNLGYSYDRRLTRIKEVLDLFNKNDLLTKRIEELDYYDKHLLLIMIAILHKPKVLLLDSVFEVFKKSLREEIVNILKKLEITIISFTNSLEEAYLSNRIILLNNKKIIGEYKPSDIYNNDKLFYDNNLEIPFLVDLSIKLKMYNLVDKEYFSMKEMVDDLWP